MILEINEGTGDIEDTLDTRETLMTLETLMFFETLKTHGCHWRCIHTRI